MNTAECASSARPTQGCSACSCACPILPLPDQDSPEQLQGWTFARAAAHYFLVPLVLAVGGASLASGPGPQALGAAAGFALGMGFAAWRARHSRSQEEAAWQQR